MADERIIRIRLEGSSARNQADRTNKSVKAVGASADKATDSMFRLSSAAAAVAAALATGALTRYADTWTSVNNQIKQATSTTREALAVQEAIFSIAKEARVDIEGVAEAYQRISNSVADFGFNAKQSLDVVEGLTKAFKANGASAQEVSSVLVQLGQGLGSGALQGEELRAILEASLPVSRALAKEFGVTVGELKRLGSEGQLTTERVFTALQKALPEFDTAFDKASKTIADGLQVAGNSITRLIGLTSEATGASETFADSLIDLSNSIDLLADSIASGAAGKIAELFRFQLQQVASDVKATTSFIFDDWDSLSKSIQMSTGSTTEFVGQAFLNIIPNIRTLTQVIAVEITAAVDKLGSYADAVQATLNPFDDVSVDQARGAFGRQSKIIDQNREAALQSIFDQREAENKAQEQFLSQSRGRLEQYRKEREARSLSLSSIGGKASPSGSSASGGNVEQDSALTEQLTRENQLIQQSLLARQGIYQQYYQGANDLQKSDFERAQAQLLIDIELQKQTEQEAFVQRLQAISDRQLSIAENKSLTDQQKSEADALLREQAVLAAQEFENTLTQITEEGSARRQQLDQAALNARISAYSGFANSALSLISAFGSQSEKTQKKFAIAESIINITAGVAKALNNPYPANLGFAAQVAAQGAALVSTIKGTSSGSTTTPSISAPSTSAAFSRSSAQASENQSQRRVIDLRGFESGGYLTKQQLTELLQSDDDVILASNSGQTQAQRTGLING
jgi:tape measure domain-containing protein